MALRVETEGAVRIITLERITARNAVDPETATALYDAFLAFDADKAADAAVLTGAGGAFCAGFDLKHAAGGMDAAWFERHAIKGPEDMAGPRPGPMGPTRLTLTKPVIAAIEGAAVAGGMELALWADLRVMAEDAFMGVYCRRWGVPLIDGGAIRLPRIIGQGRAMDLILTGRRVEAAEALAIGLADRLVPSGEARAAGVALGAEIARFPQACMRADRSIAHAQWSLSTDAAFAREWQSAEAFRTEGIEGAARFSGGKGRRGDFGDI